MIGTTQVLSMKADYTLDFRGSITSITLLKLTQTVMEMAPDEIIEIQGSDPDTKQDLFRVLPESSYEIISVEVTENKAPEGFYRIFLRKRA
jgi:TusA-related sulfurtransferase